jgi:hypothetical protein
VAQHLRLQPNDDGRRSLHVSTLVHAYPPSLNQIALVLAFVLKVRLGPALVLVLVQGQAKVLVLGLEPALLALAPGLLLVRALVRVLG